MVDGNYPAVAARAAEPQSRRRPHCTLSLSHEQQRAGTIRRPLTLPSSLGPLRHAVRCQTLPNLSSVPLEHASRSSQLAILFSFFCSRYWVSKHPPSESFFCLEYRYRYRPRLATPCTEGTDIYTHERRTSEKRYTATNCSIRSFHPRQLSFRIPTDIQIKRQAISLPPMLLFVASRSLRGVHSAFLAMHSSEFQSVV